MPDAPGAVRGRALVIVGHGSHLNRHSSDPVYAHAEAIRRMGVFDEVVEAFWKEEPSLRLALDLVTSRDVYVVPLFLAEGYFTGRVVPREMGLTGAISSVNGRKVRYCPPVGTHPAMQRMILRRALAAAPVDCAPSDVALVLIGHGTTRSPASGDSLHDLVSRLRERSEFGTVACGFLDEPPHIADVLARVGARAIVLVPFFVSEGWHTSETIPEDLGLVGPITSDRGRTIHYTPPIGTLPEMVDVILSLLEDAGAFEPPPPRRRPLSPLPIETARAAFLEWVDRAPPAGRAFLQLWLSRSPEGGYRLTHVRDRAKTDAELVSHAGSSDLLPLARTGENGAYRPLRTADDLASGWVLRGLDGAGLWDAMSRFYPGAVLHWHLARAGAPEPVPYTRWAERQSGMYEVVRALTPAEVSTVVESCCGSCLRTRLWGFGSADPERERVSPSADASPLVPCLEPCTVFGTQARRLAERSGV